MRFEVVNKQEYLDWKGKNDDVYGGGIFNYAESWAEYMEGRMKEGFSLEEVAGKYEHKGPSITGFMEAAAASVLTRCWMHGKELGEWWNRERGYP